MGFLKNGKMGGLKTLFEEKGRDFFTFGVPNFCFFFFFPLFVGQGKPQKGGGPLFGLFFL